MPCTYNAFLTLGEALLLIDAMTLFVYCSRLISSAEALMVCPDEESLEPFMFEVRYEKPYESERDSSLTRSKDAGDVVLYERCGCAWQR